MENQPLIGVFVLILALDVGAQWLLWCLRLPAILTLLLVVRPLAVFLATVHTGMCWRERMLLAWVAPRGVVAVAVAGSTRR